MSSYFSSIRVPSSPPRINRLTLSQSDSESTSDTQSQLEEEEEKQRDRLYSPRMQLGTASTSIATGTTGFRSSLSPTRSRLSGTSSSGLTSPSRHSLTTTGATSPLKLHRPTSASVAAALSSPTRSSLFTTSTSGRSIPSSPAAAHSRADTNALENTVRQLQKQLSEQELATAQERSKRMSMQAELDVYQVAPAAAPSNSTQPPPSHDAISKTTFFNHLQLDSNPDSAMWNKHLQEVQSEHLRKIQTLTNLLDEQSKEMISLRKERNEFVHNYENHVAQLQSQNAHLTQQLHIAEQQMSAERESGGQQRRQIELLQNEVAMIDDRSRSDIASLLAKLERSAQENAQLRSIYVSEKEKLQIKSAECAREIDQTGELKLELDRYQASSARYKSKAKDLVDRVRTVETHRVQLQEQVHSLTQGMEQLQARLAMAAQQLTNKTNELTNLQVDHERLREELVGKTRELTDLYAAYASAVEKHQAATRQYNQQIQNLTANYANELAAKDAAYDSALAVRDATHADTLKHHSLISTIVSPIVPTPLSHTLQLDLHRALADKQSEVLRLSSTVSSLQSELHGLRSARDPSVEVQVEMQSMRLRVERATQENVELHAKVQQMSAELQSALTTMNHYQAQSMSQLPTATTVTLQPFSNPNSNPAHLYQQIVELHQTVSTLEHELKQRELALTSSQASAAASTEAARALETQIDTLTGHLEEFRSRVLPTPSEFRSQKEKQAKEWEAQLQDQQQKEAEWRAQVRKERDELEAKMAAEESFVAKAIAIHSEEVSSEVNSLSALVSSRQNGLEPGIEHLVPKPVIYDSALSLQQSEEVLQKSVSELRSIRRAVADAYAAGLSHECITQ